METKGTRETKMIPGTGVFSDRNGIFIEQPTMHHMLVPSETPCRHPMPHDQIIVDGIDYPYRLVRPITRASMILGPVATRLRSGLVQLPDLRCELVQWLGPSYSTILCGCAGRRPYRTNCGGCDGRSASLLMVGGPPRPEYE